MKELYGNRKLRIAEFFHTGFYGEIPRTKYAFKLTLERIALSEGLVVYPCDKVYANQH